MESDTATTVTRPTAAERVRTICTQMAAAQFVTNDKPPEPCRAYQLLADGSFALTAPCGSSLATGNGVGPVILELLDHGPDSISESVRALVWIRGSIRTVGSSEVRPLLDAMAARDPNPALLDVGHSDLLLILSVESIIFADNTGAEAVDTSHILAALPDPFCLVERAWVQHLKHYHQDLVERLRLRLHPGKRRGPITLIGLDRYGLLVKTEGPQREQEHRIPFFAPVTDHAGLRRALRALTASPFTKGLRTGSNPV